MGATTERLKVTEAAMVSGVGVREVNRAVDEGILKGDFTPGDGRRFSPADCMAMTFYFGSAKRLTSEERLFAIASARPRLARLNTASFSTFPQEDWIIRDDFLTIDMGPFLKATAERLRRLAEARALVTSSAEILGGVPVITGTRIPVHDIAASRAAGYTPEDILAAYPTLAAEQIDLAILYAEANPLRGRPKTVALADGATLVSERRVPRRLGAG
jgi:uncharacterized protein (DUF433 family)